MEQQACWMTPYRVREAEGLHALTCLVLDRHNLVGKAVGGLLAEQCGLKLVAVLSSLTQALDSIEHSPPDLVLLDANCQGDHGETWRDVVMLLKQVSPKSRLILISDASDCFAPPADCEAILIGVVDKHHDWDDLIKMVTHLQDMSPRRSPVSNPQWRLQLEHLSPRELKVFHALGLGLLNKEIAQSLGLSVQTVETYRKHLNAKLGLSGSELIRAATLHRCTHPDAATELAGRLTTESIPANHEP